MATNNNEMPFPGKIAVITDVASINKDDFHSVDHLLEKYGADKIIHVTWSENFVAEQERMINIITSLAADREIRALILNHAVVGSNEAVNKLKEKRDDMFVVYCNTNDDPLASARHANLLLMFNYLSIGQAMVKQAKKQGAKSFVHYSFPRHLSSSRGLVRRDMAKETCASEGIQFVDVTAIDPVGEADQDAAHQFILEDVPKLVAKYGEDTAFFCSCCSLQTPLIKAVIDSHAIFPQPCCPSPYHGFPEALGIEKGENFSDLNYVIGEACRIADEKNMTDRLSTWPVSAAMMFTNAGAEYAIKWINGEVPRETIDNDVLLDCMNAFIEEAVGEASSVYMTSFSQNGIKYDNFKLVLMSYLDF